VTTRWNPFFKQLVMIAGLIGAVWLAFRVRAIMAPLVLAILFAYVISLPVNRLEKRTGWSRALLAGLVLLTAIIIIVVASVLVAPALYNLILSFGATLVNVITELLDVEPRPITITPELSFDLGPLYTPVNQWLRSVLQPDLASVENLQRYLYPFASGAASVVIGAVTSIFWVFFIVVLVFILVRDGPRIRGSFLKLLPGAWRPEIDRLINELGSVWNLFVRGQLVLNSVMGIIVWIAMTLLGVRNAPALGLLAAILEFIPGIGLTLAAIPAVLIALILGSSWLPIPNLAFGVIVTLTYVVLGQIENAYLMPRIVGRRVALHPAIVIVGAAAGAQLAGVLGILLAAPMIASLRVIGSYVIRKLFDLEPFPAPEPPPDPQVVWEEQVTTRPLRAVLFDLDGTLIETDNQLVERFVAASRFLDPAIPAEQRRRMARRVLMANEGLMNGVITMLDILHLDGMLFKVNGAMQRLQGHRDLADFVPVDGSLEILRDLEQRRLMLGVVTSRNREDAAAFLAQHELGDLFWVVITRDDVRRLKPHPMPVAKAAEHLGLPPEQCVMVGDTGLDVRAAKRAGALAVGVLCGFGTQGDLCDADLVLASPADLKAWL
jgi:predicted PurR-regulated permease PerM/phosphoglycolate phosphatase-like HAD superfamily hydrolase